MRVWIVFFLFSCAQPDSDESDSSDFGSDGFGQGSEGSDSSSDGGASGGGSGGSSGDSSGSGTNTDQLWNEAISDYQFTYYYNASDYSEKTVYHFCANGTGSYFWIINSSGVTGTGSQNGGDEGTWEIVETNEQLANIKVVGQTDGEGWIQMSVDADGRFYIDDTRYYREYVPC